MLTVDGKDRNVFFRRLPHHETSARDERLFVGQSDVPAGIQSGERRTKSQHAGQRVDDDRGVRFGDKLAKPVLSGQQTHGRVGQPGLQIRIAGVADVDEPGRKSTALFFELFDARARGERVDADPEFGRDVQRLRPDGAGRSKQADG